MEKIFFDPKKNILPESQKRLWPDLKFVPDMFTLYGGTAIALQLGHRNSVDFDFFGNEHFDPDKLLNEIPFLKGAKVIQREMNTLTAIVGYGDPVQVSFFGLPEIEPLMPPCYIKENGIKLASLLDLAGMKISVIQKRAEWKDYVDIATLIGAGISLDMALSAGKAIYKDQFNPQISLKALSYFDDVNGITDRVKKFLQDAVSAVDLQHLPSIERPSP